MALAAGSRLGPYEILALIGTGGMGEVYRARDPRLGRDVAIKVLPPDVAGNADRRARFEREARAVAALSHPNILALHDIGTDDDRLFVVTELLEGETLAERLQRGAVPVRKAVEIATAVARGLAGAHGKGIAHRDLKPANVFLLADGQVKVLDFGLARPAATAASGATATQAPLTDPGVVMGTAGYMAPEQVRGQQVDGRADLFALGVVLYEMLSGSRPFARDTSVETLNAILNDEPPDLAGTRTDLPPALDRIVQHCLEKNPTERFQSARDVIFALDNLSGSGSGSTRRDAAGIPKQAPLFASPRTAWAVATLAIVGAIAAIGAGRWSARPDVGAPEWIGEFLGGPAIAFAPALSPDGRSVAFQALVGNASQVGVLRPETANWQILTRGLNVGLSSVAWSTDGNIIYFERTIDDKVGVTGIFAVPVLGGEQRLVVDNGMGPRLIGNESLLFNRLNADRVPQLHRFWFESGRTEALDALLPATLLDSPYVVFPDQREIAFFGTPAGASSLAPHLYAFDLASRRLRRLAPNLIIELPDWRFPLAATPDGASVVINVRSGNLHRLVVVPRDGSASIQTLLHLTQMPATVAIGPDGSIYADQLNQPSEVLRYSPATKGVERWPAPGGDEVQALADGRFLLATSSAGKRRVMLMDANGVMSPFAQTDQETTSPIAIVGDRIAVLRLGPVGRQALALVNLADGRITGRLDRVKADSITELATAPDGKTLYAVVDGAVWTVPADGSEPRRLHAGDDVAVDPDGQYLVIAANEASGTALVRVSLKGEPDRTIATPSNPQLAPQPLASRSVGRDGRIVVRVQSSWYWDVAILDPETGRLTFPVWDRNMDMWNGAWDGAGRVVTLANRTESSLWRFRPVPR